MHLPGFEDRLKDIKLGVLSKSFFKLMDETLGINSFYDIICQELPTFRRYEQNDAFEFIVMFLDKIHEEIKIKDINYKFDYDKRKSCEQIWEDFNKRENSFITRMFGGIMLTITQCSTCRNTSEHFDPFLSLSVNSS